MLHADEGRAYEEALLEARPILWGYARARGKVGCWDFAGQIHSIRMPGAGTRFRDFLNDICRREFNGLKKDRPLLTAVVYSKHRNLPGKGFFDLGAEKYARDAIPEEERRKFWNHELTILYDYAAAHRNLP